MSSSGMYFSLGLSSRSAGALRLETLLYPLLVLGVISFDDADLGSFAHGLELGRQVRVPL